VNFEACGEVKDNEVEFGEVELDKKLISGEFAENCLYSEKC
jgi:hypothetical protein